MDWLILVEQYVLSYVSLFIQVEISILLPLFCLFEKLRLSSMFSYFLNNIVWKSINILIKKYSEKYKVVFPIILKSNILFYFTGNLSIQTFHQIKVSSMQNKFSVCIHFVSVIILIYILIFNTPSTIIIITILSLVFQINYGFPILGCSIRQLIYNKNLILSYLIR